VRKTQTASGIIFAILITAFVFLSVFGAPQDRESESIRPRSVSGDGVYDNDVKLLIDGQSPPEGSAWNSENCVFWSSADAFFVFDLGGIFEITGFLLQVDGNDDYSIDYSEDGALYIPLIQIRAAYGDVESGMDTLSSISGDPHFVEELATDPVPVRYIRISASGGDNEYSFSEIQIWGRLGESAAEDRGEDSVRLIRPANIQATGNFSNSAGLIIDGRVPFEESEWNGQECVFWDEPDTFFTLDLGDVYEIAGLVVQVDSDDDYRIEYSVNGDDYVPLVEIMRTDGEVAVGMDTLSSLPRHPEFISELEFFPIRARWIRVFALDGNGGFSVSEVQVFSSRARD